MFSSFYLFSFFGSAFLSVLHVALLKNSSGVSLECPVLWHIRGTEFSEGSFPSSALDLQPLSGDVKGVWKNPNATVRSQDHIRMIPTPPLLRNSAGFLSGSCAYELQSELNLCFTSIMFIFKAKMSLEQNEFFVGVTYSEQSFSWTWTGSAVISCSSDQCFGFLKPQYTDVGWKPACF